MSTISYVRQHAILDPDVAASTHVAILGCGTVGSNVAMQLAKAGIGKLSLYDMDIVEGHNIPSQDYFVDDVGELKSHALADRVGKVSDHVDVTAYRTELMGGEQFGAPIVVMALDSMEMRKVIFYLSVKNAPMVDLMLDFRMGGNVLQAWAVTRDVGRKEKFEKTLYSSKDVVPAVCGTRTFAPVGALSGAIATALITKHLRGEEPPPFYTMIDIDAFTMSVAGRS